MEALGISVPGLVAYIVNFAILVVVLQMLLYKPVKEMLAQRQQRIADAMSAAQRAEEEAAQQRADFEKDLAVAKQSSAEEAKKAAETTEKMRQQILDAARQEAEDIKARAREEAEQERQQVSADIEKQAAELAMSMTTKIVGRAVDQDAQRKLVDQFLTELGDA